jgi:hypothetical protein
MSRSAGRRSLTAAQVADLRNALVAIRTRISSGELVASRSTAARLEGAVTALAAVLGDLDVDEVLRLFTE